MKAARCAPTLCGGKPNDLAAGTASYRLNFLAARLDGTENPTKRPAIRRMSVNGLSRSDLNRRVTGSSFQSVGEFTRWRPLSAPFCCSFSGLLLPAQAASRMSSGCGAIGLLNFRHFRSQTASKLTLRNIAASPLLTIPAVGWCSLRQGATIASCRAMTGSSTAIIWVRAKAVLRIWTHRGASVAAAARFP